jgi:hypothetical protein
MFEESTAKVSGFEKSKPGDAGSCTCANARLPNNANTISVKYFFNRFIFLNRSFKGFQK